MTSEGLVRWTGWDLRGGAKADPAAALEFARAAPEDPDGGGRYELLAVAGRGFRPPPLLEVTPSPSDEQEQPGLRPTWSLLYQPLVETAPAEVAPYAIYLLGVDPPADASDDDLVVFNHFYTEVHLPEVAERRGALRALRYELAETIRPPYPAAPRFLAVYEVDERSAGNRRHSGPPYSKGPEVWQGHTTPWRLWYRRLGPNALPGTS